MKLLINDHRKLFALQDEFNKLFGNLKIEFYGKPSNEGSPASDRLVKAARTIGDCRVIHNKGELTITPSTKVSDLKETLAGTYGLSVAIFRKSGSKWIETANNASLESENSLAIA